ncbi:MAG: tripartite tricarboxylate transporter TctB family protein [Deltaproteobacteria bacterium]|nr:tripartite tricarboxylate transporter TctB family protein [Deltaproteobacteria bacterium]
MKILDRGSSLLWLLFSLYAGIESFRLGIGTPTNPGMGFTAFGASGLLGILSFILFWQSMVRKGEATAPPVFSGSSWSKVVLVLIAILLYAFVMPGVGYLLGTFLLMSFLFWILSPGRVWRVLAYSFLTTTITYYVFAKLLNAQLPEGLLRF